MSGVFDYVNSINNKTEMEFVEKEYLPFIVNRSFSYFIDSVIFANEMNKHAFLDKKAQYLFLYHGLTKRKRFSKWSSKKEDADVDFIMEKTGLNIKKAQEIVNVLGHEKIKEIKSEFNYGGESSRKNSE